MNWESVTKDHIIIVLGVMLGLNSATLLVVKHTLDLEVRNSVRKSECSIRINEEITEYWYECEVKPLPDPSKKLK